MPSYEYQCDACQAEFETFQSIHDEPLIECPQCKEPKLYRLISGAGIIFKGSGFYVNDSKETAEKPDSTKESKETTPKAEKQSDVKSDTKNNAKSDKKSEAAS